MTYADVHLVLLVRVHDGGGVCLCCCAKCSRRSVEVRWSRGCGCIYSLFRCRSDQGSRATSRVKLGCRWLALVTLGRDATRNRVNGYVIAPAPAQAIGGRVAWAASAVAA
jgi:hypothetical protein